MSFYRTLIAAFATVVIAAPVFADDNARQNAGDHNNSPASELSYNNQQTSQTSMDTARDETKINLNTASPKDLMKVKGINAAKARAIVAYRKKYGPFKTTDDLVKVKGFKKIKPEKRQHILDQLTV